MEPMAINTAQEMPELVGRQNRVGLLLVILLLALSMAVYYVSSKAVMLGTVIVITQPII